jgi:pilus assembly protein CpaE
MNIARTSSEAELTRVVVVTADPGFEELVRATFKASDQIALRVISGALAAVDGDIDAQTTTVAVIDLDAAPADDMRALERLMARVGAGLPVVAVTRTVDAGLARTLLQMRGADFLVKPVSPVELVRTCARVANGPAATTPT